MNDLIRPSEKRKDIGIDGCRNNESLKSVSSKGNIFKPLKLLFRNINLNLFNIKQLRSDSQHGRRNSSVYRWPEWRYGVSPAREAVPDSRATGLRSLPITPSAAGKSRKKRGFRRSEVNCRWPATSRHRQASPQITTRAGTTGFDPAAWLGTVLRRQER